MVKGGDEEVLIKGESPLVYAMNKKLEIILNTRRNELFYPIKGI